jgi:hypothetical protein
MKRVIIASLVVALVALTVPVWAEYPGNTDRNLDKHCDVSLDGQVILKKCVTITYEPTDTYFTAIGCARDPYQFKPDARADAEAVKNDINYNNKLEVGASDFTDKIENSFSHFIGIGQSNQAAGQMNNQGNVVSVAYVSNTNAYASALTAVGVTNEKNEFHANRQADGVEWFGGRNFCTLTQTDSLKDSFNCFIGIGQSNQSSGSMNNQNNAVAVAAGVAEDGGHNYGFFGGKGNMVAMASADLALTNTCNKFCLDKVTFTNSVCNSFNGFVGIGQSNQSAGNMNNQVNAVSVAAGVSLH